MKRIALAALALTGFAANADPLPESLLEKNVTFKLPSHWKVQRQTTNGSAEVLQLLIPDPDTDDTPNSSNVGITAEPSQPEATVKKFGDLRLHTEDRSLTVLTDIPAGETWRTVLSHGKQEKTAYAVIDRFGVDDGYMVAVRIAFPVIQRKDAQWTTRTMADCNALIASLKIRGKNVISSELKVDKGVFWLRDLKDPAKTFDGKK
jgi:hypothetical protein